METPRETPERAVAYFHRLPENWNCAQSVHKAYQGQTGLTDREIEDTYRTQGGGRAEGGLCGALYAARSIAQTEAQAEYITAQFAQRAGATTCRALKGECRKPCVELVDLAQELIEESRRVQ